MASWSDILVEWNTRPSEEQGVWIFSRIINALSEVSVLLNNANVILYFSAFLQKQGANLQMAAEDVNGLMSAFYGIDSREDLVVIMHTPGGELGAVESITRYIHSMFKKVTVIVPVRSMSAGAMFCLSCDKIIISKAGQLGPTDPLIYTVRGHVPVKEIIAQFEKARLDILKNERAKHVWAPILQAYGPALCEQAINVERYAKERVRGWLRNKGKSLKDANKIVEFFHDSPDYHGQRIDYQSICDHGLTELGLLDVQLLEENQKLQSAVMVAYHSATIVVEHSRVVRSIVSNKGQRWAKIDLEK